MSIESIKIVNLLPINKQQAKQMGFDKKTSESFINYHKQLNHKIFNRINKKQIITSDYNKDRGFIASLFNSTSAAKVKQTVLENFKQSNKKEEQLIFFITGHATNNGKEVVISNDVKLDVDFIKSLPEGIFANKIFYLLYCEGGLSQFADAFREKGAIVVSFDNPIQIQTIGQTLEPIFKILNPQENKTPSIKAIDLLKKTKKASKGSVPFIRVHVKILNGKNYS